MNVRYLLSWLFKGCLLLSLAACSSGENASEQSTETSDSETETETEESGELTIRANGEDFVRQGFVSKDGWQIDFDHVYVTLTDVTAYQSEPAFDANTDEELEAETTVSIDEPVTVDLAEGDETAEPIAVKTLEAPSGRYNALSWEMMPASDGPTAGQTLWLEGMAAKDGETVDFIVKLDPTLNYVCGDFVGDERKGILEAADEAELEATFHFDHLFGDGEAPADDDINTGALGFEPLAAIAEGNSLEVSMSDLESQLSPEDYDTLMSILPSLGHVGEGHCRETALEDS